MANKRLDKTQIDTMKNMVIKGVYPEDIANHFEIAVSSVHNYKKRFKDEGLVFPSVKGKRPKNSTKPKDLLQPQLVATNKVKSNQGITKNDQISFIINGVTVEISSAATYVNINKDSIEIKF